MPAAVSQGRRRFRHARTARHLRRRLLGLSASWQSVSRDMSQGQRPMSLGQNVRFAPLGGKRKRRGSANRGRAPDSGALHRGIERQQKIPCAWSAAQTRVFSAACVALGGAAPIGAGCSALHALGAGTCPSRPGGGLAQPPSESNSVVSVCTKFFKIFNDFLPCPDFSPNSHIRGEFANFRALEDGGETKPG
jgi:hypothetical protein